MPVYFEKLCIKLLNQLPLIYSNLVFQIKAFLYIILLFTSLWDALSWYFPYVRSSN